MGAGNRIMLADQFKAVLAKQIHEAENVVVIQGGIPYALKMASSTLVINVDEADRDGILHYNVTTESALEYASLFDSKFDHTRGL